MLKTTGLKREKESLRPQEWNVFSTFLNFSQVKTKPSNWNRVAPQNQHICNKTSTEVEFLKQSRDLRGTFMLLYESLIPEYFKQ